MKIYRKYFFLFMAILIYAPMAILNFPYINKNSRIESSSNYKIMILRDNKVIRKIIRLFHYRRETWCIKTYLKANLFQSMWNVSFAPSYVIRYIFWQFPIVRSTEWSHTTSACRPVKRQCSIYTYIYIYKFLIHMWCEIHHALG